MKMLKSKKALSPVVASIILIAVTVAVSIAVAAWMGALTFNFMGTEEMSITNMGFDVTLNQIKVTANVTGTTQVTINEIWVNGVKQTSTITPGLPKSIPANTGVQFVIAYTGTLVPGSQYQVKLVSAKGNQFPYTAVAPSP